jgi:hypothetical protein
MVLMRKCQWRTGLSHLELSEKWGVNPEVVKNDAGEASRRLRTDGDEFDEAERQLMLARLEHITEDALKAKNHKAAISALELRANVLGLKAPQKVEVAGNLGALTSLALSPIPDGEE